MNMEGCVWSWDRIACDWCSVIKSSPALCHPMDCSTPGFSVLHYLLEFAQTHALCQWCYPSISSSVDPFSSCLQSFPGSGSFPMSQLFTSGGQNIGASTSASVLPMNIQGWVPLGLTGLISLLSKGTLKSVLWLKDTEGLDASLFYRTEMERRWGCKVKRP